MGKKSRQRRKQARIAKEGRRLERLNGKVARPDKRPDQVYVTKKGECFHDCWCNSVNGVWLSGATSLEIITLNYAVSLGYIGCGLCEAMQDLEPEAAAHLDSIARE